MQKDLNAEVLQTVTNWGETGDWAKELSILQPTEANPRRTLLEKHLNDYTARNTFDYFIHKDLGKFLRRELDFYIKNEIMHLDEIDHAVSQSKPVYVHCWGGKGRTGTVVGCYLARHGYAQGEYVLNLIHDLRQNDPEVYHASPETRQQRDMVTNWQERE